MPFLCPVTTTCVSKNGRTMSAIIAAEIAEQVGCSRNLVYVVKAKQGGGKKTRVRRATTPNPRSKSASRTSGSDDLVEKLLASVKELERERDELRGVLDQIRQLVSGVV